jgi:predicted RNA binding protein with dsRBD fold (UPF0201 family)
MKMNVKIQVPNSDIIIYLAKCFSTDKVVKAINTLINNPRAKLGKRSVYTRETYNDGRGSWEEHHDLVRLSKEELADTKRYMEMLADMKGKECWVDFMNN